MIAFSTFANALNIESYQIIIKTTILIRTCENMTKIVQIYIKGDDYMPKSPN